MRRSASVLACLVLLFCLYSCGGGGSSSSSNSSQPSIPASAGSGTASVSACPEKTYAQADMGQEIFNQSCSFSNKVSVQLNSDGTYLYVRFKIYATSEIFTQGFLLAYDPAFLKYVGYEEGNFFKLGNAYTYPVIAPMPADVNIAGISFTGCNKQAGKEALSVMDTRVGSNLAGVAGNDTAITLKLQILSHGETTFSFADANLFDKNGVIPSCWPPDLKFKI